MRRVAFLYDGFNLYHSLREAARDLGGAGTRWLDIERLSRGLLPALGQDVRLLRTTSSRRSRGTRTGSARVRGSGSSHTSMR
jgi:hypothetical protein